MSDQRRRYRFDMIGAYQAGATDRPQVEIRRIAPDADRFEPKPIGDCWDFSASEIESPPGYVTEVASRGVRGPMFIPPKGGGW